MLIIQAIILFKSQVPLSIHLFTYLFIYFEDVSCYTASASLELQILLSQPPEQLELYIGEQYHTRQIHFFKNQNLVVTQTWMTRTLAVLN